MSSYSRRYLSCVAAHYHGIGLSVFRRIQPCVAFDLTLRLSPFLFQINSHPFASPVRVQIVDVLNDKIFDFPDIMQLEDSR